MSVSVEKDWTTAAGFRAVVRMGSMGFRCGYVAVPKGHPLHGVEYGAQCEALKSVEDEAIGKRGIIPAILAASTGAFQSPDVVFDVHGGITYSGEDAGYPVPHDGLWWFGYDCGHCDDAPSDEYLAEMRAKFPNQSFMWSRDGVHRSLSYCEAECESLARQIVERVITEKSA